LVYIYGRVKIPYLKSCSTKGFFMKNIKFKALIICSALLMNSLYAELKIKWGLSARQGDRRSMEDKHAHILNFGGKKDDFFLAFMMDMGVMLLRGLPKSTFMKYF